MAAAAISGIWCISSVGQRKNTEVSQYKQAKIRTFATTKRRNNGSKRDFVIRSAAPETAAAATDLMSTFSLPTIPGFSLAADNPWMTTIAGLVVTLPFVIQRVMTLTKEVDLTAHTVEKIAESVDKAAEELEAALPDGGLKQIVHFVEGLAEETVKDAQMVEALMHKVEAIDDKLDTLMNKKIEGPEKA